MITRFAHFIKQKFCKHNNVKLGICQDCGAIYYY